jgi:xylose isomerase
VRYGLEKEVRVNIEANHATLSGHSFEHEIATAAALGILGSIDMNRGDPQLGWDTDQFPNSLAETSLAMYYILKAGGLGTGGLNFDAKVRRQSLDPQDMFHGHVGAMDLCAQALLAAERLLADGGLDREISRRYAGWETARGKDILAGRTSLQDLADAAQAKNVDIPPTSGRQEYLENLVNRNVNP